MSLLIGLLCPIPQAGAGTSPVREQTIELHQGWNAVHLEVEPLTREPGALLTGTPIDIVAAFFPQARPTTYLRNPGDAPWLEEGWGIWYGPSRPDAVVTSLSAIVGNQAYLVHATAAYTWKVVGGVTHKPIRWKPDSYNFTGFPVDPQSPPTFEKYFAPSRAHRGQRIYRLLNDVWTPVRDTATTPMRAGEAYWAFCSGGSDYQGPIRLRLTGTTLNLGSITRDATVELVNQTTGAARLRVEVPVQGGALPLSYVNKNLSNLQTTFPPLPAQLDLPALEPGQTHFLRLAARREAMTAASQSTLLRLSDGEGVQLWLTVSAER